MSKISLSRRRLFGAGACALAAATALEESASAYAGTGLSPKNEETIRNYYAAWERKDWGSLNVLMASNFTFSSPLDDHISKSRFKKGCWDTQVRLIEKFDLARVIGSGDEAFVMYVCHTANGKTFRNVEYLRLRNEKVEAVECYFGAPSNFPSAVSSRAS